jgi:hypothetical protein
LRESLREFSFVLSRRRAEGVIKKHAIDLITKVIADDCIHVEFPQPLLAARLEDGIPPVASFDAKTVSGHARRQFPYNSVFEVPNFRDWEMRGVSGISKNLRWNVANFGDSVAGLL